MGGSNPKIAAQLTTFEQQGYLTAGPAAVTTHLELSGGRITLNGHPFPPAPPVTDRSGRGGRRLATRAHRRVGEIVAHERDVLAQLIELIGV